ncbi:hypothetical protein SY88_13845 [Clostridiales bacterium PH28_bin88]|nr:hypothetical protein SY88_13845 [Clostridiales bacterium PH28_bin88]
MGLHGRVALVTGSTKGIGYGLAHGMARAGADIVIVSRNQQDCERVAEEIRATGRRAAGLAADVTENEQVTCMVDLALQEYGRIDILVNNAGTAITARAEDITEVDFDHVTGVNLRAVFFVAQAVGKQMIRQGGGVIINVASILGLVGEKQVLPYCASKGGVIQITKALALEWAKYNIRVNALCPGYVLTPINEDELKKDRIYKHIVNKIPMRRLGQIEDLVGAAVFMASDASRYMTGQSLVIDGGWTAQ